MYVRPFTLAVAAAAIALAAASCTPSGGEPDSAATGSPVGPGTPPASPAEGSSPAGGSYDAFEAQVEVAYRDYYHCMIDHGWELERSGDEWLDGFSYGGVPEEQIDAFHTDRDSCRQESGLAGLGPPSLNEEDAASLYDVLLEVADCVRGLGYEVADPPSKQSFVEDLVAHPIPSWHPYNAASDLGPSAHARAEEECPVDWP